MSNANTSLKVVYPSLSSNFVLPTSNANTYVLIVAADDSQGNLQPIYESDSYLCVYATIDGSNVLHLNYSDGICKIGLDLDTSNITTNVYSLSSLDGGGEEHDLQ